MEQQSDGDEQNGGRERAAGPAGTQSNPAAGLAALEHNRRSLDCKEQRRTSISTASRDGDDEIVDRAAEQESRDDSPARAEPRRTRSKEKPVREISERRVP